MSRTDLVLSAMSVGGQLAKARGHVIKCGRRVADSGIAVLASVPAYPHAPP